MPGSQLDQAIAFLRAHAGQMSLVTIDIGGNDIGASCGAGDAIALSCAAAATAAARSNLVRIGLALRAAAGRRTPIVGMTYYDPGLAYWLKGSMRHLVPITLRIVGALNSSLAAGYRAAGIGVADVEGAFATHDLAHTAYLPGFGRVPLAVANVCKWTGACQQPPNNHATVTGHRLIAGAFWRALARA
jgi:hypothetical protein